MALIHKSEHSLLASLGIALVVLTGVFAVLAINFRKNETTELRSRAAFEQNPYLSPSPKVSPSVKPCQFAYRGYCYEDQSAVDMARYNYERSLKVACFLPANPFCPPAVEQPQPISECPFKYNGRCYADEQDRARAEEVANSDLPMEDAIPIDQE